jgi:hypothetical protein
MMSSHLQPMLPLAHLVLLQLELQLEQQQLLLLHVVS